MACIKAAATSVRRLVESILSLLHATWRWRWRGTRSKLQSMATVATVTAAVAATAVATATFRQVYETDIR